MDELKEVWRPIKGYEGLYEISNMGRVKSLAKEWVAGYGIVRKKPETILKKGIDSNGYFMVVLCNNNCKTTKVHILVYEHFGSGKRNGRDISIDHIDENRLNNRIDNLQLLTSRENTSKGYRHKETSSKHTGVWWNKEMNKWSAKIRLHGKQKYLGSYAVELEAAIAYRQALCEVQLEQKVNTALGVYAK